MGDAGGVVRVAQQQRCLPGHGARHGQGTVERVQVEAPVGTEWGFDEGAASGPGESVERRVDRRADHDGVAGRGDQFERLGDAHHDVGDDRGPAGVEAVPVPVERGVVAHGEGVAGAGGVAGVAGVDGGVQRVGDRRCERDVHLGHP
jgi:hypothetical protein